MASGLLREQHLLTVGILRLLDDRYAALPRPGRFLHLLVTNVRNRPLSSTSISSMKGSVLSLYHNLITGSRSFPIIPYKGGFRSRQVATPFVYVEPEQKENTKPSPLMEQPSGLMVPTASHSSASPTVLTPRLPEKTDMGALLADHRNCIRQIKCDGKPVTRVVSLVSRSDSTELNNRWRVSDYAADGHVLMSVLCQFTKESAQCAKRKRTAPEEVIESPPRKRLRV